MVVFASAVSSPLPGLLNQSLIIDSKQGLDMLQRMQKEGMPLWRDILYVSVQACRDVSAGRRIHALMVSSGFDSMAVLGDPLIRLFGSCQSLFDANLLFCTVDKPSGFTWHSIIWAHTMLGEHGKVFELYQVMQQQVSVKPGKHIISCILKSCAAIKALWEGMFVHSEALLDAYEADVVVGSCLIDMYAKCGCLHEARNVFDMLPSPNEVVWNVMITSYIYLEYDFLAVQLFQKMQQIGIKLGKVTFLCVLKVWQNESCSFLWARWVHNLILRSGLESDIEVGSALVDIYVRWRNLEEACVLFAGMPKKNSAAWVSMISGYAQHGYGDLAVRAFEDMQRAGLKPDQVVFSCVLKSLASKETSKKGMLLHSQIIMDGTNVDVVLGSSLVDMYVKCGDISAAHKVFNMMPVKNLITWSALIGGHAEYGDESLVCKLFVEMQKQQIQPDRITLVSLLQACSRMPAAWAGITVRVTLSQIIEMGLESDGVLASNLVKLLADCGSLEEALVLFKNLSLQQANVWGDLISAYARSGLDEQALMLFQRAQEAGITIETEAIMSILKSCGRLGALSEGKSSHEILINKGHEMGVALNNSVLEMYTSCSAMKEACDFFSEMSTRDVASWGIMMTGYNNIGYGHHALQMFTKMLETGVEPDTVAFSSALNACCTIGSLRQGRAVHDAFLRSGHELDIVAGNTLIDFYAKCGSLDDACRVFELLPSQNEVSWNSMAAGFADHGMLELAGRCLVDMQALRVKPSAATYCSLFAACSHVGQVEKARDLFNGMTGLLDLTPSAEHFNCMADVLARTGHLHEAEELLQVAPVLPDALGLTSLLTACKVHVNSEFGQQYHKKIGLLTADS